MTRAEHFMDRFAREAFDLKYYWGRVEFAPGRGAIHLHILGIAKNKAYLQDFHNTKGEKKKTEVLQNYPLKNQNFIWVYINSVLINHFEHFIWDMFISLLLHIYIIYNID